MPAEVEPSKVPSLGSLTRDEVALLADALEHLTRYTGRKYRQHEPLLEKLDRWLERQDEMARLRDATVR